MTSPPEIVDDVPACVVAVYAHPDDADVSCGGALARWSLEGSEVHLVVCTRGDKGSSDPAADVDRLVATRADETSAAAECLGVRAVHHLGLADGDLDNDHRLRREIVRVIRAVRPQAVVCPDPTSVFFGDHYYNHRDHRVVGWATLDAASPAAGSPLYYPDAGDAWSVDTVYLSGSLEVDVLIDVEGSIDRKAAAVLCHQSQLGETGELFAVAVRERATETGRLGDLAFAEAFRRVRFSH